MYYFSEKVNNYAAQYKKIKNDKKFTESNLMNVSTYFVADDDILALPRDEGDSRYVYNRNGLNLWVYASGYMHANEGLFSTFVTATEGKEPRVAFFAGFPKKDGTYDVLSLLQVPDMGNDETMSVERYSIITSTCAYFITELPDIRFTVRVFANFDKEIYFSVMAQNLTSNSREFFISSFINPFLRHNLFEDIENRFYRLTEYLTSTEGENGMGSFLFSVNEHMSRVLMIKNYGVLNRNYELGSDSKLISSDVTTSRYGLVGGSMGSLNNPVSLYKGNLGKTKIACSVTEVSAAADILHFELASNDKLVCEMRLNITNDEELKNKLINEKINVANSDVELDDLIKIDAERNKNLKVNFGETTSGIVKNNVLNSFIEHVKRQVELCSLHKGYLQLWENSLIGIRDVFQALEALLYWQPNETKKVIIEALNYIDSSGRCPRQYSLPINEHSTPIMDLRPYIDQGVWVISTIAAYLKFTGDFDILDQKCGYYDIVDEKSKLVKKIELEDTVLEHMFRIINYLESNRDHEYTKCLRILYGDWNDALDALGVSNDPNEEYGTGVSVMASLQYYENLNDMIELLIKLDSDKYADKIELYKKNAQELKNSLFEHAIAVNNDGDKKILHGWGDKKSYDIGSFKDPDGIDRVGLAANSFWIISKMYDSKPELKSILMDSFKKLDSKYGMKTFDHGFASDSPGVGRINKLPEGVYENGAAYVHATCFGIWGLMRLGESEFAWDQISKILPFTHETLSVSPFVMPNSYTYNEALNIDGESVLDWQTGSSNVLIKDLIRYVFGLQSEYDGYFIAPAKYLPFKSFNFEIKIGDCLVVLNYYNNNQDKRAFEVNGKVMNTTIDPISGIDRIWLDRSVFKTDKVVIDIR